MKILLALIIFAVLFVVFVWHLEETSVFIPSKEIANTPDQIKLAYEDIYFETSDGVKLNGWFIKNPQAKATVIFFHGNAGNIADRLGKIQLFHYLNLNVFIIDYRGYGRSEGKSSEKGMYLDAVAAYDYLKTRDDVDMDQIISYGASLGGVAAVDLVIKRPVAAVIIDSSFTSVTDMAKTYYPFVPSFMIRTKMDSVPKVKQMDIPKLFIHSPEDRTVPIELGQKLYEAAADPKEFIIITGDHNDGHLASEKIYREGIAGFLEKYNLR